MRTVGLIASAAVIAGLAVAICKPRDFPEYWAAGRLNATPGGDPYSPDQLFELQRAVEPDRDEAVMMWNPPWVQPVVTPFGVMSFPVGRWLWLTLQTAAVLFGVRWAWRIYSPPTQSAGGEGVSGGPWLPFALAMSFAPTWFLIRFGQITGLPFLGLCGFLLCIRDRRPFLAGVLGSLTAIKPHLFPLFALALLLEAMRHRDGRKVILGGVVALAALALSQWLINPDILSQYRQALTRPKSDVHEPLTSWALPTVGYLLRESFPGRPFWVQFVPLVVAVIGFLPYYWLRAKSWDWAVELPRIVIVSLLTACYGGWTFDLVPLLLPVIHAATRLPRRHWFVVGGIYLTLNVVAMIPGTTARWFVWVTPAVALSYWLIMSRFARCR